MTSRADTFDRANSTSSLGTPSDGGSAWTALSGTWGISSNQAYTSAAVSDSLAVLDSGSADTTVGVTVATNSSNPGLIWRASDVNNLFLWTRSGVVYRKQSGSYTSLGTRSAFTSGDVIEVDLSGSTFTGWKNGVSWGADITSTFNQTATKHGLRSDNNTGNRFDDFAVTDAGGATDLVVADATHAHSADSPSLTQDHQLSVQDAAHAHSTDSPALTQQHVLGADGASHAHAADSLDLTTEDALAIAEALHGHIADGVVLTQEHVLAVADALHEHTADEVTLDTATALQIADAVHEHLADNLGLTQAHVLAIAEALHAHRAGDVVLGVPLQDAGGGGPDAEVFDAPYRAYVKRVEAERLADREAKVAAREEVADPAVAAVALEPVLSAVVEPDVGLERMAGPVRPAAVAEIAQPADTAADVQDLTAVREEARRARQEREMQLILTALLMAA